MEAGGAVERCRAVIDLRALVANFEIARRQAGGAEVIAVVKADAYGHGDVRVAGALVDAGCSRLAVVTVSEAVALRDAGLQVPILVMGGMGSSEEAREVVARGLTPVLHDARPIPWLTAAVDGPPLPVHVEVDTGMHRMGVSWPTASLLLESLHESPELALEGVYTHLARADEVDLEPSLRQVDRLARLLEGVGALGIEPPCIHFANSAGLLAGGVLSGRLPRVDAVRPGLMLYGVTPADHLTPPEGLQPVMTLRARVVALRNVPKGEGVGYAGMFRASRDTRVATLPLGYEDGVPISTSNRGTVCIRGQRLPIVGRVSMDFITVEVGDATVELGDEAVIFGGSGAMHRAVEEAAADAGTIPYELLVRVGSRVPRVYEA